MSSEEKYKAKFAKKFGDFKEEDLYVGMSLVYGRLVRMKFSEKESLREEHDYLIDDHVCGPVDNDSDTYVDGHQIAEMYPVPSSLWRALAEQWGQGRLVTLNDLAPYEKVVTTLDDYCNQSEMKEDADGYLPYNDPKLDYEKKAVYHYFRNHPADKNKPQRTPYSNLVDKYKVSDTYDYYIVPNGF